MNLSPCAYVFGSGIHWFVVVRAALVDLKQAQILEPSNKAVSLSGRVLCMDIFEYIYVCVFVMQHSIDSHANIYGRHIVPILSLG